MNSAFLAISTSGGPALLILVALILLLVGAKMLPAFLRILGKNMDEFDKAKEAFQERLARAQENLFWNQYDADKQSDVTQRWKRLPEESRTQFWAPRRSWRLGLGRVLKASLY